MATIFLSNGKTRKVKNLGWLIRNASRISVIHIDPHPSEETGCVLTAHINNGDKYATDWASKTVCWDWLRFRRVLKGIRVCWGKAYWSDCDKLGNTMLSLIA